MISRFTWLSTCLFVSLAALAFADDDCSSAYNGNVCSQCQTCRATCKVKICRVTETTKKEPKTKFSCECEDFCIPGKSTLLGYKCDCGSCCEGKCKKNWKPGCGEVRTRLILKKETVDEEVTDYKWEVVEACQACAGMLQGQAGGCCSSACSQVDCAGNCAASESQSIASAPIQIAQPTAPARKPTNPVSRLSQILFRGRVTKQ